MKPFVNVFEAPVAAEQSHGDAFGVKMAPLAAPLGAQKIGANLSRVPPGKAAFPFHHHYANEEHFYIVRGMGVLRSGDETHAVRAGDYLVHPAGGPERAHQLVNVGREELVYLAISTLTYPEVVGYPDSEKTGVRTPATGTQDSARFLVDDRTRNQVNYYDREDGARVRELVAQNRKTP